MNTEYKELAARIRAATTREELARIEKIATRIYNAGLLTPNELARLDIMIIDRGIMIMD